MNGLIWSCSLRLSTIGTSRLLFQIWGVSLGGYLSLVQFQTYNLIYIFQSGLVDPSLSIALCNESASNVGANEQSQIHDGNLFSS